MRKSDFYLAGSIQILGLVIQIASGMAATPQLVTAEASPESFGILRFQLDGEDVNGCSADPCVDEELETTPSLPIDQTDSAGTVEMQTDSMITLEEQVTSVNQLSDVQPTDWAYQALRSLVERYAVIAGYPDGTFRGNRAMSRYEFAAALNIALERINPLIQATPELPLFQEDLLQLQRLQEQFATELAIVRGRVDALEARTAELEATQFSTTTKLSGQAVFAVTGGGFSGERIIDPVGRQITTEDPNTTFIYRAALDLNTSFKGSDLLKIRLDQGSNGPNDNPAGFLEPSFGSVLDFSTKPPVEDITVSRLYYTFKPSKDLSVTLGPRMTATDYLDFNRYAQLSFRDFSTQALINNYILFPVQGLGAGAAFSWKPNNGSLTVRGVYVALAGNDPSSGGAVFVPGSFPVARILYPGGSDERGLFGDPNQGIVELEYAPSKTFAVRLQYSTGNVFDGQFDVFGANFEWALSNRIGIFGRYGYGRFDDTAVGDIHPNYWMAGVSFPDLFVKGARSGIAVGQPFIANELGNSTQTNIEAYYNFPLSNSITVTPLVQVIVNPANQDDNGTIVTGTLRTVFLF